MRALEALNIVVVIVATLFGLFCLSVGESAIHEIEGLVSLCVAGLAQIAAVHLEVNR